MTVAELIEQLARLPDQSARVVVSGYERGYHDLTPTNIGPVRIKLNHYTEWYYGPHEDVHEDEQPDETALLIGRDS